MLLLFALRAESLNLRARGDKATSNNLDKLAIRPRRGIYAEWHFATGSAPPHSRPNPNAGWNTVPASASDSFRAFMTTILAQRRIGYLLGLPYMKQFFEYWTLNIGNELFIDMNEFLAVSSAERSTVNEALKGAAEFAEANLRIGQARTIMTQSQGRPTGNLSSESTDLWNAVGGHTGFAKALIKKTSFTNFEMNFEYRLEDFFTFGGKGFFPGFHNWHLKGLAHDFLVAGVYERNFQWSIGGFNGRV